MQRSGRSPLNRRVPVALVVCAAVLAACTSSKGVTDTTASPTPDATSPATDATDATDAPTATTAITTPAVDDAPSGLVALPGLLDASDDPIANDEQVRTGVLDNGLVYYVRHNERPGAKASMRLAIHAGSVNETGEYSGYAHFIEHMLFNGTERFPKNELIDVLRSFGAEFGADINAYTDYDETVYQLDVPANDESIDNGLTVLEEWLSNATFDADQVEAERGVVLDEWRNSTQSLFGRLADIAQRMYLAGSAYEGRDAIGTDAAIQGVPRDVLVQFYDDWYRPDNAAVVVVGDIDVDDMVDQIEQRFAPVQPRNETMPARPSTAVDPGTEPAFALHSDPDQTTVDVEVDLPLPAFESTGTASLRVSVLDSMIYDTIIRRLDRDITDGTAAFDQIGPGDNGWVRSLDAPALYAITTADRVTPTLQALLDEYERVARFGFTEAEAELARSSTQAQFDSLYAGRDSTQDTDFADQYVEHYLRGAPYPTADTLYTVASETIGAVTAEALDLRFRARWSNTAPHIIISTPESDASAMPSEADVLAMVAALPTASLDDRGASADLPDQLMETPEPVEPSDVERLTGDGSPLFDPVQFTYPNGTRVIVVGNDISAGQVSFQAVSPGGSSLVADDDVIDALFGPDVVTQSGVASFSQSDLEQILADRDASVSATIDPYVDGFFGSAATSDVDVAFQLMHLYMTQPRFDQVGLSQVQRLQGPTIEDPSSSPDAAGFDALMQARYGDQLRYAVLPTPEQFATLDLAGIERVWRDRFGDAGDWTFVFVGDVDPDRIQELANSYIGTLPGDATVEQWVDVEDAPPPGVTKVAVNAGTGETSSVTLLFTSPIAPDDVDASIRATAEVASEVLTERLTDVVRESLGESYSPFAISLLDSDPEPQVLTYVQVTGAPDRIESVGDLVVSEFADLATNGVTDREYQGAIATVTERYGFVNNGLFLEELVNAALWPGFDLVDFLDRDRVIGGVTVADVQRFIATHVTADHYVQAAVLPR